MSEILSTNPSVVATGTTREPTLLITDMDGSNELPDVYLLDFNEQITDDFQLTKTNEYTLQFLTFGRAPMYMTIGGVQPFSVISKERVSRKQDVETYFRNHSLSSPSPKVLTVNTMATPGGGSKAGQGIYNAYMHQFNKLPSADATLNGYQFTIKLICWVKQ